MDPSFTDLSQPPTLLRLALALGIGLFVGMERERRGKEAGLRTFGFAGLLGGLGGLLGAPFAVTSLALLGVLVGFLNWQALRADQGSELTTSAALLVTAFTGILCGQGYTVTPVAVGVVAAALLAWKERLAGFTLELTEPEVRSAILLALLAFVVYPLLPAQPLDPWDLVDPRTAWITVILIAAIGFVNYVLLKVYGARGTALAGFLGGLVNSTVTVTELAARVRETKGRLSHAAYRGVLLSTAAMVVRNAVLLGILAVGALAASVLGLLAMLAASLGLAVFTGRRREQEAGPAAPVHIESPFSLSAAIRFGVIFVALQVSGTLAERLLGPVGFYGVSLVGGLVSSASAVATAATLASHGTIGAQVAGNGALIASVASAAVNLPLVSRVASEPLLTRRLGQALGLVVLAGLAGAAVQLLAGPLRLPG